MINLKPGHIYVIDTQSGQAFGGFNSVYQAATSDGIEPTDVIIQVYDAKGKFYTTPQLVQSKPKPRAEKITLDFNSKKIIVDTKEPVTIAPGRVLENGEVAFPTDKPGLDWFLIIKQCRENAKSVVVLGNPIIQGEWL